MRKLIPIVVLLFGCAIAQAAPPYDVTVDLTAPTDGGAVDSYVLYLDDAAVGNVTPGSNTFPDLLTADGTYVFEVAAINAAGQVRSDPVEVVISEIALPGKPSIQIQVSCDPCVISITP